MSRITDRSPSIEALSNRNRTQLLDIFSAATPILEEIAKVKPESWRNMRGLFTALEGTFGVQSMMSGALKPAQMLQTQATNFLGGALAPLMVGINNIKRDIERRALQNPIPTLIGTGIGFVAGFFIGSPQLGAIIGGFLGSTFGPTQVSRDEFTTFLDLFGLELTGPPSDPTGVSGGIPFVSISDIYDSFFDTQPDPITAGPASTPGGQFGGRLGQMGRFQ